MENLDLNLLVTLDVLLNEGSVVGAAKRFERHQQVGACVQVERGALVVERHRAAAIGLAAVAFSAWLLYGELRYTSLDDVWAGLVAIRPHQWVLAALSALEVAGMHEALRGPPGEVVAARGAGVVAPRPDATLAPVTVTGRPGWRWRISGGGVMAGCGGIGGATAGRVSGRGIAARPPGSSDGIGDSRPMRRS